ncbi:MAG TPA: glycosyltransferase [Chitinophagales bacterium]|nr:hypothetical protein [Bacteroidota bacterium]HQU76802.1 glycosyltransferase [Chitinophagales bacterium]
MIEIGISTIDDRIKQACMILDQRLANVRYRVCHQVTDSKDHSHVYERYPDVEFLVMHEKGLSKSRNRLLHSSHADWLYLCDDDVIPENISHLLKTAVQDQPDTSICCFMLKDENGHALKRYAAEAYQINRRTAGGVSSAEVIYHLPSLLQAGLAFDERFGLGSEYISGEENLLLDQALKKGLKIRFFPMYIGSHPALRTGILFTPELVRSKGALHAARYGAGATLMNLLFACRKFRLYKDQMSPAAFLRYIYSGSKDYQRHG